VRKKRKFKKRDRVVLKNSLNLGMLVGRSGVVVELTMRRTIQTYTVAFGSAGMFGNIEEGQLAHEEVSVGR